MKTEHEDNEIKTPEAQPSAQPNNLSIPTAIVIAGILVAGAVLLGTPNNSNREEVKVPQPRGVEQQAEGLENMREISRNDHILGNFDAPVKIVEYSDFECPFCKRFHGTMGQVMDEYGKDGKVAWVYRHFPLDQLHPVKARKEAVASECANELGGNDAFWKFANRFYELTPSNNQTDIDTVLPQIAKEIGLDVILFNACLESGKYDKHIEDDVENAIVTGGRGTPWSIVVAKNGKKYPLSGALPYDSVKQLIELALQEK